MKEVYYIDKYSGVTYEETIDAVNKIRNMAQVARLGYGTGFVQRKLDGASGGSGQKTM